MNHFGIASKQPGTMIGSVAVNAAASTCCQDFPSSKRNSQVPFRSSGRGAATTPTAATSAAKNTFFFILMSFSSLFYGTQIADAIRICVLQ